MVLPLVVTTCLCVERILAADLYCTAVTHESSPRATTWDRMSYRYNLRKMPWDNGTWTSQVKVPPTC
jgi:hypothetical protein